MSTEKVGTTYHLASRHHGAALDVSNKCEHKTPTGLRRRLPVDRVMAAAGRQLVIPFAVAAVAWWAAPLKLPLLLQSLLTLAIVTPLGPLVYRLAYEKLADASVLVLLIVSIGTH